MNIIGYYAAKLGKTAMEISSAAMILRTPIEGKSAEIDIIRWDESRLGPKPSSEELAEIDAMPAPEPAPFVPDIISDRQFFQQLALDGEITQDEALDAVTIGKMPEKLANIISALPTSQQFSAKMLVGGATEFHRSNPIVPVLGQALGKDSAALDAIWIAAAAL